MIILVVLAIILYTLKFFRVLPSKAVISFTFYTIAVITYLVIINLIIYIFSSIVPPSNYKLDPRI